MNDLRSLLTSEQISEIELYKEMCVGMSVDGKPIICFDILSNILHNKLSIEDLSNDEILNVYAQLKGYKGIWKEAIWFDSRNLEQIFFIFREQVNSIRRESDGT
ncbi:hypothetical protein [uncultured Brevibacillus sp.]|uniref:hypothetical protein n=1 Tax=uncultured Brevibacillus sp. TaxID=169970 RepID=UPI0025969F69|nr:hypothetical protein [uncultured Brevibacillus sp.]